MPVFDGLRAGLRRLVNLGRYNDLPEERYFEELHARLTNASGVHITEEAALQLSTVWSCVVLIAGALASMPLRVYRRTGARREPDQDSIVDWLLHMQPNPELSAYDFHFMTTVYKLLWGNAYVEIERDGARRPLNLWPIEPWRVRPARVDGLLVYRVRNADNRYADILPADILHFRGVSIDGLSGLSVVAQARQSMGLSVAMETFGAAFFGNGAHLGAVIEQPAGKGMSPEAQKEMLESFNARHRGAARSGRSELLPPGFVHKTIAVPPEDAQFLESRKFQVAEICRWFRVPPHKLFDLDRATFSNIEHLGIEFIVDALLSHAVQKEQEINIKLFGRQQRGAMYVKHNFNALSRGDQKTRNEAYAIGRQWGWLSANDVRELEDMNPIGPEGDIYLSPTNMVPADQARERAQPPEPAAAVGADDDDGEPTDEELRQMAAQLRLIRNHGGRHA